MRFLKTSILNVEKDMTGVTVGMKELKRFVEKKGSQMEIVSPYTYPESALLYKVLKRSSRIYQKSNNAYIFLVVLFIKTLLIYLQVRKLKNNYDHFHAHDVFSAIPFFITVGKKKTMLLTAHFPSNPWDEFADAGYVKRDSIPYKILRRISLWVLINKNLKLLANSEKNYRNLQRIFPDYAIPKVIFYRGIEVETRLTDVENKSDYMINVGRINCRKNQIFLIEILAELEKAGITIPLYFVGPDENGEKHKILALIKKHKIKSEVRFFGQQNEEKTRQLMAKAQLYIHTSLQESFGRTLIEAINLHTPVLALEYEAAHEIIDEQAMIKHDWDAAQSARFVATFINNKNKRQHLQQKQYQHFLKYFTEDIMVENYYQYVGQSGGLICA